MYTKTQEELQSTIEQLDQAIHNHELWFESINRAMLCHLPYNDIETCKDSHRLCHFGEWLYQDLELKQRELPAISAIEEAHHQMHDDAATMLQCVHKNGHSPVQTYDHFAHSLKQFRLELNTLKQELQDTLYSRDSLTSANNRIGMLTYLREQHELVRRGNLSLCVAMFDLDHFKQVNDGHGHQFGDQVLKGAARFILDNIRPYDRLFRYGGEEFLLTMPQTSLQQAETVVERLRHGLKQLVFTTSDGISMSITASIGLAEDTGTTPIEMLIRQSDQALYQAKQQGRNRLITWQKGMEQVHTLAS